MELASRLSFFLWSSIPDDELLDVATRAGCAIRRRSQQQVRRMLADPKADALVENFAGQWLYLRELENVQTEAKNFDENLRRGVPARDRDALQRIVREDRSLLDLIDADYTFVDERLARHYGIPNVHGSYFRRVPLAAGQPAPRPARAGQHADGDVGRHAHVAGVARQVGAREPARHAAAGAAAGRRDEPRRRGRRPRPPRCAQRLEAHRANPVCASCHKIMDPMGFALENFDLVGQWRELDGPTPIDSTGQLADGTPVSGPADLRRAVLSRSDAFMTTATEKLLTYALGRPVHYVRHAGGARDRPARGGERQRFSSLVLGIIESDAFQKRVKKYAESTDRQTA